MNFDPFNDEDLTCVLLSKCSISTTVTWSVSNCWGGGVGDGGDCQAGLQKSAKVLRHKMTNCTSGLIHVHMFNTQLIQGIQHSFFMPQRVPAVLLKIIFALT